MILLDDDNLSCIETQCEQQEVKHGGRWDETGMWFLFNTLLILLRNTLEFCFKLPKKEPAADIRCKRISFIGLNT